MLAGDFFTITTIASADDNITATLQLNPAHRIFEGHFPGQPVVPGVCMMQMIKEILESVIGKKTRLIKSEQVKFLAMIDPRVDKIIKATLKYNTANPEEFHVTASLANDITVFLKLKGIFIPDY